MVETFCRAEHGVCYETSAERERARSVNEQHAQEGSNTQEAATPRVRPGSPAPAVAMAVVRCTRTVTRSYAVGYARRPVRAVTANTRTQNAKLTHNRRLAARVAARRVASPCAYKVVLKASLPSIRRGCYILVRTCDLHLSMHLRVAELDHALPVLPIRFRKHGYAGRGTGDGHAADAVKRTTWLLPLDASSACPQRVPQILAD